ncbi:unnamed protein product [Spirodela intermedia]|uniref:Uncharacterized protein n=1 Tax=Spirodela intermedia TaxID=51605 RepID=A0A7I8K6M3_SPIIN|nr:unnamed protein product [Spirodela intermedia]
MGREQQPHVGASLVDPLLAAPKEETHYRHPHNRRWMHQGRKERKRELIVNEERAGGSSPLLRLCALHWAF